ncbi:hypothetical protein EU513_04835 [Yimella sp. RIT 621]|uniref:hypothetical protein n=1 Tax=Yimella sp. RIT 621 TaxID=2510323 RepID=UPI00101DD8F2|nr:hypothetical protein [Yimella sp. RIT 621]RYG77888.1 hypothetical protein EU513_04835 [Yimella sp. RIT 621]
MGVVLGVIVAVAGVIFITGAVALPDSIANNLAPETLGWILLAAGVLLVPSLLATRRRKTTVVERNVVTDRPLDGR